MVGDSGSLPPTFTHQQGQVDGFLVAAGGGKEAGVEVLGKGREWRQFLQTDLESARTAQSTGTSVGSDR